MSAAERRRRASEADALCTAALAQALEGADGTGVALVAVGGYGRSELAPHSDLDVVLVHDDGDEAVDVRRVAERVWYPLWDAGADLDHSVRALSAATDAARSDPRVALGLLDARHLAGDPSVTLRLRTELLAHWRRAARAQLPALRRLVSTRGERQGELAHASVPDLKESVGGLRDATVLKGLVATWLVDVSHTDLERSRLQLLDVRDALHEVTGRATDRVAPELWGDLADRLGLADAEAAQRQVREAGRRITHLSRLTWHRVDGVLARSPARLRRAPDLERVAAGVAVSGVEVVLERGTSPAADPLLLLRAAAEAAERSLVLAPATAARLAREGTAPVEPWGRQARNLFTRLLAAGDGLLPVWETLDETGALDRVLPEWTRVRLLPHASVVHRFTVDRHLVETCIEAARLIRRVPRADVLMAAAILHDIGKGGLVDHCLAGAPLATAAARRMGFDARETELVGRLVRRHLLLADIATTRDLEDPATVRAVVEHVPDLETLDLLAVLTEADARATSAKAWTAWRAGLVADLVRRARDLLHDSPHPTPVPSAAGTTPGTGLPVVAVPSSLREDPRRIDVRVLRADDGATVTVVSGDRIGLMADVAGALAVQRASVRSARAWSQDDLAVSMWEIDEPSLDEAMLRERLDAVAAGRLDPGARLRAPHGQRLEPAVQVRHEASRLATVLEVRVDDRPGVVYRACAALAGLDLSVRSAHLTTLGPQAVDVFYVQEPGGGVLSDERAASAVHAVRRALQGTVTLDAGRG
ncbi:MAG TPA: [protein-PII] uridylyltransferase [Nocardioidaceae bacterium]|nr:[protein-PII] uridylyltransferase [Nocardioidaceae bacterium]